MKKKDNSQSHICPSCGTDNGDTQSDVFSVLAALEDLISIVDKHYRYVAVSQGYTQFFGRPAHEIIGKHASELHGEARFEKTLKPMLDRALAGEEVLFQYWAQNHKGETKFLGSRYTLYTGNLITGKGIAVVAKDITVLMQTQAALEKEKQLLNTMINAIPDFIFIKDKQGTYQRCNKSFEALLETSADNIIGKTDNDLMSGSSAHYIRNKDAEVINTKQEIRCDEPVTYNDGQRRLVDMLKLPLFGQDNDIEGIIGIGHDVTREREIEYKLQLAALVFDTTSDCCFILSKEGRIQSANLAAKERFPQVTTDKQILVTTMFYCSNIPPTLEKVIRSELSWHGEITSQDQSPFLATLNAVLDDDQHVDKFVLTLRDNSLHKARERELLTQAYHDHLTGLPNRLLLKTKLESAIIRAERQRRQIAVLFIDLDKFKPVNDLHGHFEGDQILIEVAKRLHNNMRKVDTLSRLGGDEFIALIDIADTSQAKLVAEKITLCIEQPFSVKGTSVNLSASIGISLFPSDSRTAEQLLQNADEAMYHAKSNTLHSFSFFTDIPHTTQTHKPKKPTNLT